MPASRRRGTHNLPLGAARPQHLCHGCAKAWPPVHAGQQASELPRSTRCEPCAALAWGQVLRRLSKGACVARHDAQGGWPASEPVAIGALAEGHPALRANRASGPGERGVKHGKRRHPAGAARRQNGLFDARVAACEPICECISGPISRSLAHMWEVAVALATSVLSVHTGGSEVARQAASVELDAP